MRGRLNAAPAEDGFAELTFDAMTHYLYRYAGEGKLALIVHVRPDGDCVGSAFALRKLLSVIGCESWVVCADKLPARLRFLGDGQGEIAASAAPEEFAPGTGCRAVCIDVAAPSQIGCLDGQYNVLLTLDHHSSSVAVSDRYLDSGASATGEIVWRIARNWLRAGIIHEIPDEVAMNVYAAISSDTGCFRYSNVTPVTHRIAAQLIGQIPEHAEIDRLLFEVKTEGRIEAEKAAATMLRKYDGGRIVVCPITAQRIAELGIEYEELDALIDVARSEQGSELAFSIREEADGSYRVSARANTEIDVSKLCVKFGGGGHQRASGCSIHVPTIEEAERIIVAEARELLGI